MTRTLALIIGVVLVLIGIGGFFFPGGNIAGLLNVDTLENIIHIVSGGLLVYAGTSKSAGVTRGIVGGLGVIYLIVAVIGLFDHTIFGLMPHMYGTIDNIIHLVLGVLLAILAGLGPRETVTTSSSTTTTSNR